MAGTRPDPAPADAPAALRLCPTCGHDLTGLPAENVICPECGGLFTVLAGAEQEKAAARPGAAPALGSHAAKGFTFMLVQGVGTRVVTFVCQLVLSYLLLKKDFGLLAIADSIATFAGIFQLIGVREILVSRQKRFHLWANAGFWIMTSTGWATAALLCAAAPLAARAYGSPELTGLIVVIALSIPLYSMGVVAEARLQAQLRFKFLAGVIGLWAVMLPVLMVVFAALGFGVYALVVPRLIVALVRLVIVHRAAGLPLRWNPQLRRWRFIVGTSVVYFFTSLLLLVVQIGDRPLLGAFVDEEHVGAYSLAFAFSLQAIMMIAVNLQQVLFATLARLNDEPGRQLAAFLRALRVLAAIVTPVCLLQAAASEPLVRTVFDWDKWKDAVPIMQILGLGMVFHGSYCPASAMMEAQRRFRTKLRVAAFHAAVFLAAVLGGTVIGLRTHGPHGAAVGASVGVALCLAITSPVWAWAAIRTMGGTWRDTLGIVGRPLVAGCLAVGGGAVLAAAVSRLGVGYTLMGRGLEHWLRLAVLCASAGPAYAVLMRVLMPRECRELGGKFASIARRIWPPGATVISRLCGAAE